MINKVQRTFVWLASMASLVVYQGAFADSPEAKKKDDKKSEIAKKEENSKSILANGPKITEKPGNYEILSKKLTLNDAAKQIDLLTGQGFLAIAKPTQDDSAKGMYDVTVLEADFIAAGDFLAYEREQMEERRRQECLDLTPNAPGCICPFNGPIISVEGLAWHISEDSLKYAVKLNVSTLPVASSGTFISKEPDFEWEPGVRLGIGWHIPYYGWDTIFKWTWIRTSPKDKTTSPLHLVFPTASFYAQVISSLAGATPGADTAAEVKSRWSCHVNILDWELGRNYFISRRLSIRPHGGVKAAIIDQHFRVNYAGLTGLTTGLNPIFTAKNDFGGIGPCIGSDTRFKLPENVGIFFNFAAAAIVGRFDAESNLFDAAFCRYDQWKVSPMMQFYTGIDWGYCFGRKDYFSFQLGYEVQYWWNQNRFPTIQDLTSNLTNASDFMMHGVTAGIRFDF